jgi:hypothetical protein
LFNEVLRHRQAPDRRLSVTLVECPIIATVGMGEATVPNMPRALMGCGISEQAFLAACNTSFKLGVLFDGWNVDTAGNPIAFVNPFTAPPPIDGVDVAASCLAHGAGELDFGHLSSPWLDLLEQARAFSRKTTHAYHLDAGRTRAASPMSTTRSRTWRWTRAGLSPRCSWTRRGGCRWNW